MCYDDEVYYVELNSETIFKIHMIPFGYGEVKQVLSVFEKENSNLFGITNSYDAALLRMKKADVCSLEML
jgi:hypothetical protein